MFYTYVLQTAPSLMNHTSHTCFQIALVAFSFHHLAQLMSMLALWRSLPTAYTQLALVAVYLNVN